MPLRWLRKPQSWSVPDGASLLVAAGPRTDWFVDPQRSAEPKLNAPALLGDSSGDFLLSARRHGRLRRDLRRAGVLVVVRERRRLGEALLDVLAAA